MNDKWKNAFNEIHAEPELKQSTMDYLSDRVYSRRGREKKKIFTVPRFAAAAACLAAVLLFGEYRLYFIPTAFISVDINPSLELGINRFDRIVSVEGYNDDGQALADSLNIRFMNYQDALEQLLEEDTVEELLSQDGVMSLTVAGDNDAQSSEILEHVESCVDGQQNIHCHSGNSEEMHSAHESGMSFGKYEAFLRLQELDPSITADDVKNLSMHEIFDLIEEYSEDHNSENHNNVDDTSSSGTGSQSGQNNSSGDSSCTGTGSGAGAGTDSAGAGRETGSGTGAGADSAWHEGHHGSHHDR